jgi:hypothetical protein
MHIAVYTLWLAGRQTASCSQYAKQLSALQITFFLTNMDTAFPTSRFFRNPALTEVLKFCLGSNVTISDGNHTCEVQNFPAVSNNVRMEKH